MVTWSNVYWAVEPVITIKEKTLFLCFGIIYYICVVRLFTYTTFLFLDIETCGSWIPSGYSGWCVFQWQIYLTECAWSLLVFQTGERYLQKYPIATISGLAVTIHLHSCSSVVVQICWGFFVEMTSHSPSTIWPASGIRDVLGAILGHH